MGEIVSRLRGEDGLGKKLAGEVESRETSHDLSIVALSQAWHLL
jgi:hypothetical protein